MEPKLPRLNNLAGHVGECKGAKDDKKKDELTSEDKINIKQSVEIMEAYLKEGELNPAVVVTYRGFLRIFSAWIIDESLPWTAGEAPTLQMLFRYLKITYQLPSDTTVRNQLAHIFEELCGKVIREFAVRISVSRSSRFLILRVLSGSQIQDRLCNRYMDYTADGIHICMLSRVFC